MSSTWVHGELPDPGASSPTESRVARVPTGTPTRNGAPSATAALAQWTQVGPAVTLRGSAFGLPRAAGAVRALAVSADGQRIYAGSPTGGVWYSGDGGARWTALDFYSSTADATGALVAGDALAVGAIAVAWDSGGDAAKDVVYVGSGVRPPTGLDAVTRAKGGADVRVATMGGVGIRVATGPVDGVAKNGPTGAGWVVEGTNISGVAVYRLAFDRATDGVVWAATSGGLYKRPAGGGAKWTKVDAGLGDDDVTDVVTIAGVGSEPQRIYAASADGHVAWSSDGSHWNAVALPAFPDAQVKSSVKLERVVLAAGNTPGSAIVYALAGGPRLWRIDGGTAQTVGGVPSTVARQGVPDDLALVVHPSTDAAHRDLIAVGGWEQEYPKGLRQAALFVGQVVSSGGVLSFPSTPGSGGAPQTEWVGNGVPAGILALVWIAPASPGTGPPTPSQLWVGCEEGVFMSNRDGASDSFAARNSGLAIANSVALAQHPAALDVLLLSTEDALCRSLGAETWEIRASVRGGGVAIDPGDGRLMFAQVGGADWFFSSNGGETFAPLPIFSPAAGSASPTQRKAWQHALADERTGAAPASRMAITTWNGGADVARVANDVTQLAIGTDRIWFRTWSKDDKELGTPTGGKTGWVTLPTASDPFDPALAAPDRTQDRLDAAVLALVWGSVDRLYALTKTSVYLVERDAAGTWKRTQLYDQAAVHRNWKGKLPVGTMPDDLRLAALAVELADVGSGTVYVGGSQAAKESHLWWFDGTSTWISTEFPDTGAVHAIAVDPADVTIVYVGTDTGVWKGDRTASATAPAWTWTRFSDGLPEAPCVDLVPYRLEEGERLLRAALAGRGVWEVRLDGSQGPQVYLRAHEQEARHGLASPLDPTGLHIPRNAFSLVGAQMPLDASPDVRVWRQPTAPVLARHNVPLGSDPFDTWVLQAKLRRFDRAVEPDRVLTTAGMAALNNQIAAHGLVLPPSPDAIWAAIVVDNDLPFDLSPPDHADIAAHLREEPDRWPKGTPASCATDDSARIYVTVHSRHWKPVASTDVWVSLLRSPYGRDPNLGGVTTTGPVVGLPGVKALPTGWANTLRGVLAGTGTWPAGDWEYLSSAQPSAPLEPGYPQVVSFDRSLAGTDWDTPGYVLLAVVHSTVDPLAETKTDVAALVRTSSHVAARSVRKSRLLVEDPANFPGFDIKDYPLLGTMDTGWTESNAFFTGIYLDSPLKDPNEQNVAPIIPAADAALPVHHYYGHHRTGEGTAVHPYSDWVDAWSELYPDWGALPIYWGQQDPRNGSRITPKPPNTPYYSAQGPYDLRPVIAEANAADAATKAGDWGLPPGAVIYLDYEMSGAPIATGIDYCKTWFHKLAEHGYRPGVYSHGEVSSVFRLHCPGLFVWNVYLAGTPPHAWQVESGQLLISSTPSPAPPPHAHDLDALSRQWLFGGQLPALPPTNPMPQAFKPDLDISVLANGAFPEDRQRVGQIRGGHASAVASAAGECSVYAIRRGVPKRAIWAPRSSRIESMTDPRRTASVWNPFSPVAALRIGSVVVGTASVAVNADWLLGAAYVASEAEGAWRLHALRRVGTGDWQLGTVPTAGFPIDPLPGVAATSWTDGSALVFAVDRSTGLVCAGRWDPSTHAWGWLEHLGATAGPVVRTNRLAAVGRDADKLDAFWVDGTHTVQTSSRATNGTWSAPVTAGSADVSVHPLTNPVAVGTGTRLDLVVVGQRPTDTDWRLYATSSTKAGTWSASAVAGGDTVKLEPMAPIAACSRDATTVDVFAVGDDGALYTTQLNRGTGIWTPLAQEGGSPPSPLASVDAAVGQANDIEVVCTGRDGNVYATRWDSTSGTYTALEEVTTLHLV